MFRFQHVEYLWLLLAVPVLAVVYLGFLRWRRRKTKDMGDPVLVGKLFKGRPPGRATTKFVLLSLSFICVVIAAADLQSAGQTEKAERKGLDIMFALDVSNSMLARDIASDRISAAKQLMLRTIDKLKNDRAGLIVFAGKSYLQVPLTIDYGALKMMLGSTSPGMIPTQGTVLADAINLAVKSFNEQEDKHKVIVLISDGEDHDSQAMDAAKKAKAEGVTIFTIGIGSPEGSTIYDPRTQKEKVDRSGETVITRLNEEELKGIANATAGGYWKLTNVSATAGDIVKEIGKMESRSLGEVVFTNYKSYYQQFLGAGLILLIVLLLLPDSRIGKRWQKPAVLTLLIMVGMVGFPVLSFAQKDAARKQIKAGNKAYKEGAYGIAEGHYRTATQSDPQGSIGIFNLGNTLYQKSDYENSRKSFVASVALAKEEAEKARAFHNIGNTYMQEKKWKEAIEAYKQSLRLNGKSADTKYNLAYAQRMLRDNESEDDSQDKQDDHEDNKDQEKQDKEADGKDKDQNDDSGEKEKEGAADDQNQRPPGQPSKLSQQEAENLLNALQQEEKKLHEQSKEKERGAPIDLDKDW